MIISGPWLSDFDSWNVNKVKFYELNINEGKVLLRFILTQKLKTWNFHQILKLAFCVWVNYSLDKFYKF